MFNVNEAAHEATVTRMARALATAADQAWVPGVAKRYAAYLRVLADESEAALAAAEKRGLPDTDQAREYAVKTRAAIAEHRQFASDLELGVTVVNAPPRCEALCRIFEANRGVVLGEPIPAPEPEKTSAARPPFGKRKNSK